MPTPNNKLLQNLKKRLDDDDPEIIANILSMKPSSIKAILNGDLEIDIELGELIHRTGDKIIELRQQMEKFRNEAVVV